MSIFSAILVEGICLATKWDREKVKGAIDDIERSIEEDIGEIRQRVGGIMANCSDPNEQFNQVVQYSDTVLTNTMKVKLFEGLGLAVLGGFLLAAGEVLAVLVGLVMLYKAGQLAMTPFKIGLASLASSLERARQEF